MSKYHTLERVLTDAMEQASRGKGKERHADGEPFENQKICVIGRWLKDSPVAGPLQQAVKKTVESSRLSGERAINELRGAINYLAAAIILLEEITPPESEEEPLWGKPFNPAMPTEEEEIPIVNDEPLWGHSILDDHLTIYNTIIGEDSAKRLCAMCEFGSLPVNEMPCKKCFYLPFKPHWKPQN
jgi:hypothetical protein